MKEKDTKTRILDLAESLIQDKGFNGFSYQDISSVLAVKNAAIHYYYPTKEELGEEVIRRARQRFHKWIAKPETIASDVCERLEGFLSIYTYHIEKGSNACLLGSLGNGFLTLPGRMQHESRLLLDDMSQWLGLLLEEGRMLKIFTFSGTGQQRALYLMSVLAGALLVSRLTDKSHYYEIVQQIKQELMS